MKTFMPTKIALIKTSLSSRNQLGKSLRSKSSLRLALISLAALSFVLTACSSSSSSQTATSIATSTTEAVAPESTSTTLEPESGVGRLSYVYGPIVGDCIDLRSMATGKATTITPVPTQDASLKSDKDVMLRLSCDLPHQYEVIAVFEGPPEASSPEQLIALAKRKCPAEFLNYLGTSYSTSSLEMGWVIPPENQRNRGVRITGCVVYDPDGKLVGSVKDSKR